jgi:hypothetical protein
MKPISKLRFDSLAGYSRSPIFSFLFQEIGWYEEADEKVLGVLAFDISDKDYNFVVLGRDKKGRFRTLEPGFPQPTTEEAYKELGVKLAEYAKMPPEAFYQEDEVGKPLDFFKPLVEAEKQNVGFSALISDRGRSSARELLAEMMHYFEDVDGNFVKDFQSTGFDARVWELYLYALFTELGYGFDHQHAAPDFHCKGLLGEFYVEATTVNPSAKNPEINESKLQAYFEHYVPIKFGSVLLSKLQKKYWELPHVAGHPLLIAVQDFHAPQAMSWSNSSLVEYLYGIRQVERKKSDGSSEIVSERVETYRWEGKEIPAGFFLQPHTENISAVLANPNGTISKFSRMGFLAGFGDRDVRMIRNGICYRGSLTAESFVSAVHSPDYSETWCEGLSVYHNPKATHPFPEEALPAAAHHYRRDGQIFSRNPPFYPIGSHTMIIVPMKDSHT